MLAAEVDADKQNRNTMRTDSRNQNDPRSKTNVRINTANVIRN